MMGFGESVPSVKLDEQPPGTVVTVRTNLEVYKVYVADVTRKIIEGNRPVIEAVRVQEGAADILAFSRGEGLSDEALMESFGASQKFPDTSDNEIRIGHHWQFNDKDAGLVQEIAIGSSGLFARRRLG